MALFALIVGRQAGVLAGQNAAGIGHELLEQGDILEVKSVNGEIDLGLGRGVRASMVEPPLPPRPDLFRDVFCVA